MKKVLVSVIALMIIALAFPYIQAEILTKAYGNETEMLYEQTSMIENDNYQKVLKYTKNKTEVLYITSGAIFKCRFIKENDMWEWEWWDCVISTTGSASGLTYPMYFFKK